MPVNTKALDLENTIDQPNPWPTNKVTAGTLAAAVVAIGAWVASMFGVDIPAGVEGAMVTLLGFIAAYFVPDRALH